MPYSAWHKYVEMLMVSFSDMHKYVTITTYKLLYRLIPGNLYAI